jgi:lysophospholipase L1-like esterase
LPDEPSVIPWDHARYDPDVIVVNLGTNDLSTGLALDELPAHRERFRRAYSNLLAHMRHIHPHASIFAVVGPMMNDAFPPGYLAWTSIREDVRTVVEARRSSGDPDTFFFALEPQTGPYGEDWHPTVATHRRMADALVQLIREKKSW